MVNLFIVSVEKAAGKTAICAGIGKNLLAGGKKIGFLKLLLDGGNDGDADFMKRALNLSETADFFCQPIGDSDKVKAACSQVSQDKDVVLIEGRLGQSPKDDISQASYKIAKALKARVIIVEGFSDRISKYVDSYKGFGDSLSGIILNKVPGSQFKRRTEEASSQFGQAGITFLGALPEDRALASLTIGEIAECLQGKILNNAEKSTDLVENFMLGAMVVDSGVEYFGRINNKAVIVKSDRADMQMAALETATKCLVLSGSKELPIHQVFQKATGKKIPIIVTEKDASAIIASIEEALGKTRFQQEKKLPRLAEIMQQHLNWQALHKLLDSAS